MLLCILCFLGYDKLTEWMQRPLENNISGLCPSGLENLAVLNELYVKQRRNLTEGTFLIGDYNLFILRFHLQCLGMQVPP